MTGPSPCSLGVETALTSALDRDEQPLLSEMYREWPFFRSTIDLIEMALAKADARIAAMYDRTLVERGLRPFGDELRDRPALAVSAVLRVAGHREPVEDNPVLRRSIDVRNPYVDSINLVHIELLRRLRAAHGAESRAASGAASNVASGVDERIRRAFAVSVNGMAAGTRNTG